MQRAASRADRGAGIYAADDLRLRIHGYGKTDCPGSPFPTGKPFQNAHESADVLPKVGSAVGG